MQLLYSRCAGLDVHKLTVVACFIHTPASGPPEQEIRTFGTTTRDLLQLLDWLTTRGCTHVAMESTAEYWRPIWNLLEGHLTLLLVNPQHMKHVPGRKTDVQDAAWIADLLRHGLLKASFVPERPQRDLRDLTRGRGKLVEERAAVLNRLQKILEGANIKLSGVVSDILGVSSRDMLQALITGTATPEEMAELARGRLRNKKEALAAALDGRVRDHHRFLLTQALTHLDFLEELIEGFDREVVARLTALSDRETSGPEGEDRGDHPSPAPPDGADGAPARPVRRAALPPREPPTLLKALSLLDPIPGIGARVGQAVLAEVGTDMHRFPTEHHLTAWAGVAPGNRQSGGKRYPSRTRHGNPILRKTLVQAAHAASKVKGSYFHTLYHRIAGRRGKKRAIVAVARSLLVVIYHVLLWQEPYRDLGANYFDERQRGSLANHLVHRLQKLGYEVTLAPTEVAA
jgi:transposase